MSLMRRVQNLTMKVLSTSRDDSSSVIESSRGFFLISPNVHTNSSVQPDLAEEEAIGLFEGIVVYQARPTRPTQLMGVLAFRPPPPVVVHASTTPRKLRFEAKHSEHTKQTEINVDEHQRTRKNS